VDRAIVKQAGVCSFLIPNLRPLKAFQGQILLTHRLKAILEKKQIDRRLKRHNIITCK
jgi:hypothetical protein